MIQDLKQRVFNVIERTTKPTISNTIFDWFIILLIATNVLLVILDTFPFSDGIKKVFYKIEIISITVFSIEYVFRLWTSNLMYPNLNPIKARLKYVFSFMAIVDLLAIIPFYLPFLISIDLRVLRIIRLLRLLRLLKINRYTNALASVWSVIRNKSAQLVSSLLVLFLLLITASVLLYNMEHVEQPDIFTDFFEGLWWSISVTTQVQFGDNYPATMLGKMLSSLVALLGIGLVAVPTGIISAGFMEAEKNRFDDEKKCPHCGKSLACGQSKVEV
ncbi:MAG: ion transporter [Chitinispirillales bacterium]|nr:ion transporter [Chitinispirillales bacterium]